MSEGGWARVDRGQVAARRRLGVGLDLRRHLTDVGDAVLCLGDDLDLARRGHRLRAVVRDREDRVVAGLLERDLGGVDGGERVAFRGGLLRAVAPLGDEHVGRRREGAERLRTRGGRDVERGLAVDEAGLVVDDAERDAVLAGGEDRGRHPELGARRAGLVGDLLQRAAAGGGEVRGGHGLRGADLLAQAALAGTCDAGSSSSHRRRRSPRPARRRRAARGAACPSASVRRGLRTAALPARRAWRARALPPSTCVAPAEADRERPVERLAGRRPRARRRARCRCVVR